MIRLNPRTTTKVDICSPLLELFRQKYTPESMPDIEGILRNFQTTRDQLLDPIKYYGDEANSMSFIEKAKEYISMHTNIFRCINASLPKISFQWTDSMTKKLVVLTNPGAEKLSMLFNLAIMSYSLAVSQVGKAKYKEAITNYSTSALLFNKVKTDAIVLKTDEIGVDFNFTNIQFNINLCKAMMQFCAIEVKKPEFINKPSLVLAKICKCASNLFSTTHQYTTSSSLPMPLKKLFTKTQITTFSFAAKLYDAFSMFYAARFYGDDTVNPDVMNTIDIALTLLKNCSPLFEQCAKIKDVDGLIMSVYTQNKDFVEIRKKYIIDKNKNVYRAIPATNLPIIEALEIPKKLNADEVLQVNFSGKDLLRRIVPVEIIKYEKEYYEKVKEIQDKAQELEKSIENEEKEFFEKHNLMEQLFNIQDQETNYEFPEDLMKFLEKVHFKNGIDGLNDLYDSVKGETENWNYFIERCDEKINEEESKYETNRKALGDKWTQKPSGELNKEFKKDIAEGKQKIEESKLEIDLYKNTIYDKEETNCLLNFVSSDINELIKIIPQSIIISEVLPKGAGEQ